VEELKTLESDKEELVKNVEKHCNTIFQMKSYKKTLISRKLAHMLMLSQQLLTNKK